MHARYFVPAGPSWRILGQVVRAVVHVGVVSESEYQGPKAGFAEVSIAASPAA